MAKLNAYLHKHSILHGANLDAADQDALLKALLITNMQMSNGSYVLVGHVEAPITLLPRREVVKSQIASLEAQRKQLMADAQAASVELSRQINSLLAIEGAATEMVA